MKLSKIVLGLIFVGFLGACSSSDKSMLDGAKEISEAKYSCPMSCEGGHIYDEAGVCPICGMDLEEITTEMDFETQHLDHPAH